MAMESAANGAADGTTIVMSPLGDLTLHPHIFRSLRYDPLKDLVPLGGVASMSFGLAVSANSPAKTLSDFLRIAKSDPSKASYGTPGVGSAMHFIGSLLSKDAQVPLNHVPSKGGSAAMTDVIAGVLPATVTTAPCSC